MGDDGIGSLGDDASRRDPHRLPGFERAGRGRAGGDPEDDGQPPGRLFRSEREAVHRGARERRQIDDGVRSLREVPARGLLDRDPFRRQRPNPRQDCGQSVVEV